MYTTVKAVWKGDHLEPLEAIKTGKNIRYLITVIDDREKQRPEESEAFGFIKAQEILKHYAGSLSDAVIDEREQAR
jgi:hypothetical protein